MNVCPHCHSNHCLPLWRKLCLGPAGSTRCRVCGLKIAIVAGKAWPVMLAGLAAILSMVVLAGFSEFIAAADLRRWLALFAAVLLACIALYAVRVPLRVDELSNADLVARGRAEVAARKRAGAGG
ncbi:hypothetical protein [Dokdonella sp.]|uniref:hypothetical protein n=1 Tax=Dokdonella sp. TaxID=2291710 RepID=UPI001B17FDCB|nr:hypothetical protein [Dokdonella sp.]MBO9663629.1 hypothetical protein [Dokdonella sp.]